MGKHERGYKRIKDDHYPTTPGWVVPALVEHVDLRGLRCWEMACGSGEMAEAIRKAGAAFVFATDIVDRGYKRFNGVFDFTKQAGFSAKAPRGGSIISPRVRAYVSNPPYGERGALAEVFIRSGLERLQSGDWLALLLPADFDSAGTRLELFDDCPEFVGKIVLTKRIKWFNKPVPCRVCNGRGRIRRSTCTKCAGAGGKLVGPKENHCWFLWRGGHARPRSVPAGVMYAPRTMARAA